MAAQKVKFTNKIRLRIHSIGPLSSFILCKGYKAGYYVLYIQNNKFYMLYTFERKKKLISKCYVALQQGAIL